MCEMKRKPMLLSQSRKKSSRNFIMENRNIDKMPSDFKVIIRWYKVCNVNKNKECFTIRKM